MATPIPQNAASFTVHEARDATRGVLIARGDMGVHERTTSVSTDTRALQPGALFVALRGETFDAHDHLYVAVKGGARVLVVERDIAAPPSVAVIRVESALEALGQLARAHARSWRAQSSPGGARKIIAITGSAGKTTTRVAAQALLETLHPGEVHATAGNLNNLVGAPMVLFGLEPHHRFAVVEIGTNRPGEIEALASMVEPDVGAVTLVAEAHIEELGSLEGVAHEKAALYRALRPEGVAIGNGDSAPVAKAIASSPARTKILYGTGESAQVRVLSREPRGMTQSRVRVGVAGAELDFVTPLLGEAGALACAAAIACGAALGETMNSAVAQEAFGGLEIGGGAGRLVPVLVGGDVVVIDDSYNANPASMRASIRAAAEIAAAERRRLVLVLGEMRELGVAAESGHEDVGRAAAESDAALVIAVGPLAERFVRAIPEGAAGHAHVAAAAEAAALATQWVMPGDLVLVKGSRGIGTDAVVRALKDHFGGDAQGDAQGGAGVRA